MDELKLEIPIDDIVEYAFADKIKEKLVEAGFSLHESIGCYDDTLNRVRVYIQYTRLGGSKTSQELNVGPIQTVLNAIDGVLKEYENRLYPSEVDSLIVAKGHLTIIQRHRGLR